MEITEEEKEKIIEAGKIVSQIRKEVKEWIKPGMKLLDIAEKIENRIVELGGKPAFPVNTSINEIAAHYTPSHDDETTAHGLLKVDFGAHIDGWPADNSIPFDLENSEENKKLINASEESLKKATETIREGIELGELGKNIQETAESHGFIPIVNLYGHSMDQYDLHSGITLPNIENNSDEEIEEGLYALEPFVTNGNGKVKEGKPSGIYQLINLKNTRNPLAREILNHIAEEYDELPFCSRWLVKKFGARALLALRQLEKEEILQHYDQLTETSKSPVAQSEHTVLISNGEVIITTKE